MVLHKKGNVEVIGNAISPWVYIIFSIIIRAGHATNIYLCDNVLDLQWHEKYEKCLDLDVYRE